VSVQRCFNVGFQQTLNAETPVPKRLLLLSGLVAALLAVSASSAQAASFFLSLSDGTNTVEVHDGAGLDTNTFANMISATSVAVGTFTVNVTATALSTASVPIDLRIGSMTVTSNQGKGKLTASLWRTDLSPAALSLGPSVTATSSAGATVGTTNPLGPAGYVAFNHSVAGTSVFSTEIPGTPTTGTAITPLAPALFSLVAQIEFNFTTDATRSMNASTSLKLANAPATAVPEPTTLLLFGPGILGLLALGRHRRLSNTL
jgi:hypothetical protein